MKKILLLLVLQIATLYAFTISDGILAKKTAQTATGLPIGGIPAGLAEETAQTATGLPIGGIPAGTGSGTYIHSGTLQDFTPVLQDGSKYYHKILSGKNDSFVLQDKKITTASGAAAFAVSGTPGDNQTITIEGNKFQNIGSRAIFVKNVDNVIIQGNYYDNVRTCIHINNAKNITIQYEKFKNHASGWGYNKYLLGHVIAVNDSILDSLLVKGVLVDRSDAPYAGLDLSDGSADRNDYALASDYINFRTVHMAPGKIGYIENSMISGSENIGEAQSGAGFIADHDCSGLVFRNLVVFNTSEGLLSSANSSVTFENIIGCHTAKASRNLTYTARSDPSDPYYGKISKYTAGGVGSFWYAGHSCDAANGSAGPTSYKNVRVVSYRADDLSSYFGGRFVSETTGRAVPGSTWFNTEDCNFAITADSLDTYAGKCGVDTLYRSTMKGDEGTASLPTPDEVCQIMFGMNYTPGMATNGAMFAKWGTASNHEMYFDESRK